MELKGKVALVAGSGAGIGLGCAIELARAGASVILNDIDGKRLADAVQAVLKVATGGANVWGSQMDVFDRTQAQLLVSDALSSAGFGKIDILVTGPASSTDKSFLDTDLDAELQATKDDLFSHLHLAQLAARDMVARKAGGKIIFISSVYGVLNRKKQLGYDVSKAGLNHATRKLARELGQNNILVNAISPGFTDTPGEREHADDAKVREIVDGLLLGRAGTPKDIGEAAVYLAKADYITGVVLTVDGGMSLVDYTYDKRERR